MSGVGSSPTRGTCETSQNMFTDVPDGFSQGPPVSLHLPMSINNLERDVKQNKTSCIPESTVKTSI